MIDNFAGKTAVLTGAGSGFGLECARIGARLGMNLVLVDVQQDALDKAQAEIEATGAAVLARRVDVSSAAEMEVEAWAAPKGSYSLSARLVKPDRPPGWRRVRMRSLRPVRILCG